MLVRDGVDPENIDEDVAFRTTYYFRVFDYCASLQHTQTGGEDTYNGVVPLTDSLYRFRMTGKIDTLATEVRFESGTLKSYEIDPLGAQVEYDKNTKRFRFISQREADQQARAQAALAEFREWLNYYRNLVLDNIKQEREAENGDGLPSKSALIPQSTLEKIKDVMEARLGEFASRKRDQATVQNLIDSSRGTWEAKFMATARALTLAAEVIDDEALRLARDADTKVAQASQTKDVWLNAKTAYLEAREAHRNAKEELVQKERMIDTVDGEIAGMIALSSTTEQTDLQTSQLDELKQKQKRRKDDISNLETQINDLEAAAENAKEERDNTVREHQESVRDAELAHERAAAKFDEILDTAEPLAVYTEQRAFSLGADTSTDGEILCPAGLTRRRGFQVLGPEGWRTFDQDERLILAMSTSARPLIGTLKELSNRVLDARAGEKTQIFPLVEERLRTAEAEAALRRLDLSIDEFTVEGKEPLEPVLDAFENSSAAVVE